MWNKLLVIAATAGTISAPIAAKAQSDVQGGVTVGVARGSRIFQVID
jgi:hypothetical protein